uniref:G-protein coupled receptors family 1 profile domain-containing protein n=1 Tax=Ditylenchus dipsaci TaxID=166011 RepID=A0A915ENH1_9BILA
MEFSRVSLTSLNLQDCSPLKYVDPNLTQFVIAHLGERCVSPTIFAPTVIIYGLILLLGISGNICTCIVIVRNKSMHQTATNYYLFSLAISDILMLVLGLPMELYGVFDVLYPYRFGEFICKSRAFLIETLASYCFPLRVKVFSTFDRAVKVIVACWISAFIAALPVCWIVVINRLPLPEYVYEKAWLTQITHDNKTIMGTDYCAMDFTRLSAQKNFIYTAFLIFFLLPALLITIVYCHIMISLAGSTQSAMLDSAKQKMRTRKSLLKILVSVVVMFFLCWLPFHVQRLLTIYLNESDSSSFTSSNSAIHSVFNLVFYISGYCYYSNSACNPILYNILSKNYRIAFCQTILSKRWTKKFLRGKYHSSYRSYLYTHQHSQQFAISSKVSTTQPPGFNLTEHKRNCSLQPTSSTNGSFRRGIYQLKPTLSQPLISSSNKSSRNGSLTDSTVTLTSKPARTSIVSLKPETSLLVDKSFEEKWPGCETGIDVIGNLSKTLPLIDDI